MCFVDLDKAFDRVQTKVLEWVMRKTVLDSWGLGLAKNWTITTVNKAPSSLALAIISSLIC